MRHGKREQVRNPYLWPNESTQGPAVRPRTGHDGFRTPFFGERGGGVRPYLLQQQANAGVNARRRAR